MTSVYKNLDFTALQSSVKKLFGTEKRCTNYLIRKLLCTLDTILASVDIIPTSIRVEVQEVKILSQGKGSTKNMDRLLDEEREKDLSKKRRNNIKQWLLHAIYGTPYEPMCPTCESTLSSVKTRVQSTVRGEDGKDKETTSVIYYCLNEDCSQKTYTVPTRHRELGAQTTKEAKSKGFIHLIIRRASLRVSSFDFYGRKLKGCYTSLLRWVHEKAASAPTFSELFALRQSGVLIIDEKWVKIGTEWSYMYLAVEPESLDLPYQQIFPSNNKDCTKAFLLKLKELGFTPQVIVTDQLQSYQSAIKEVFPECEHLECLLHVRRSCSLSIREAAKKLKQQCSQKIAQEIAAGLDHDTTDKQIESLSQDLQDLRGSLHKVFKSKTKSELEANWQKFLKLRERESLRELVEKLGHCYRHVIKHIESKKKAPSTTNAVERVIRAFEQKYGPMESFKTMHSAQCWCDLFQLYWRLTPFHSGKRRGQSPAQLMGYPVKDLRFDDWIQGVVVPDEAA